MLQMPSYFFHIAFDLDGAAASAGDPFQVNQLQAAPHKEGQFPEDFIASKLGGRGNFTNNTNNKPNRNQEATVSQQPFRDWRYDTISIQNIDMAPTGGTDKPEGRSATVTNVANGISAGPRGLATKGRYEPCDPQREELGWGVVRLYRDSDETPGLYDEPSSPKNSRTGRRHLKKDNDEQPHFRDEDCTTLCILAVPSYLTPSDFLGFVGERTRDAVSHFRMIRTERGNRYMVLMKFRNGKRAREWRREWNGKAFDGMEVSLAHAPLGSKV